MPKRATSLAVSTPDDHASALARLEVVADQARDYAAAARAPNTVRAYHADWADFSQWCAVHGQQPLPATGETVALYLTDLAEYAPAG